MTACRHENTFTPYNQRNSRHANTFTPQNQRNNSNVSFFKVRPYKRKSDSEESSSEKRPRLDDVATGEGDGQNDASEDITMTSDQPTSSSDARERLFSDTVGPIFRLSKADLDDMDKEIDEEMGSDESENTQEKSDMNDESFRETPEGEDNQEIDQESKLRQKVLGYVSDDSSSDDSLSGDYPRGWPKQYRSAPGEKYDDNRHLLELDDPGESNLALLKASMESSHWVFEETTNSSQQPDDDDTDFNESIGSVDDEMAAAVERELFK